MLDVLYFVGQVLFLFGLAYGACLAVSTSPAFLAVCEAARERARGIKSKRKANEPDPHGTELGYWP